ncbi:MotA/TolQ/ExbB proton channel family protein [Beggiatoa leptomitoformis]|uniref:Biopolymer transport protein ExbB n=1 Tax=Beggiatoa leptomitoformis TaxID=288004 RepID=A0A650GD15_9GAMM|nr:MotA/TolQ/ExbB proton channel family protein [Beggiatoa leptomitoformis]ALG69058.1 MotA/TolQ/ExbB proton channel family protein [Beggiatoa leptomitoformis]QGX04140.1 MotA/TolQ/ExbB proton channel family protein [Beggiatoa leptomitoformis]
MSHFGFSDFLQHVADNPMALSILLLLLLMSILSWYLIITKLLKLWFVHLQARRFQHFFNTVMVLEELIQWLTTHKARDPFSRLALQGVIAAAHHADVVTKQVGTICTQSEFITRAMRRTMNEEREKLNSGLSILASISSTAPFVGLLGTVMGIYGALMSISSQGNATLETVAAPVGEALIMTAVGLTVAIPAVLGYNALIRGNRNLFNELDGFAHDLYAYLNTGVKIDTTQLSALSIEKTTVQTNINEQTDGQTPSNNIVNTENMTINQENSH